MAEIRGRRMVFLREVYDFSDPYWRVRYPDGDWEEMNRQQIKRGRSWRQLQFEPGVRDGSSGEPDGTWKGVDRLEL